MRTRNPAKATRNESTKSVPASVERLSEQQDVVIDAEKHEAIALAAYYIAAERGFEPGHELEDWVEAEIQLDATRRSS